MKYSGVGGQAVMEGVMMRNGDRYAVAVRTPDKKVHVEGFDYKLGLKTKALRKIPVVRGVISFVDSLYLGMSTLMYSASFFEDDEPRPSMKEGITEEERKKLEAKEKRQDDAAMTGAVLLSIGFTVAFFFVLPYFISAFLQRYITSHLLLVVLEGLLRLTLFVGYVSGISLMPDIRRTYMYHGAEHKCINCIEHGLELNVENVRKSSRLHKRCGTSFLLIVMVISIVFFMFIRVDSRWMKLVIRLLLIPVIAGVSFEFIRLAGKNDNKLIDCLSAPGLLLQRVTTKEPDDDMIEIGIASVNEVFDWKTWQKEAGLLAEENK